LESTVHHPAEPPWLVPEPYDDVVLGPLKTGKEAEIFVVERIGADRSCLLAHKRYRPRTVTTKGELEALGFQRSAAFVNDRAYRDDRKMAASRDQRAVDKKTRYGRELLRQQWPATELDVLQRLWAAGATVPYPLGSTDDGLLMQYVGDHEQAAPPLARARLDRTELADAFDQLVENLRTFMAVGIVHADLSPYNLLWWHDRLWFIDVPQAVDVASNLHAIEFLHRDVHNVCTWFGRKGIECDAEAVFAELLASG
jgi:RIO kinase 1